MEPQNFQEWKKVTLSHIAGTVAGGNTVHRVRCCQDPVTLRKWRCSVGRHTVNTLMRSCLDNEMYKADNELKKWKLSILKTSKKCINLNYLWLYIIIIISLLLLLLFLQGKSQAFMWYHKIRNKLVYPITWYMSVPAHCYMATCTPTKFRPTLLKCKKIKGKHVETRFNKVKLVLNRIGGITIYLLVTPFLKHCVMSDDAVLSKFKM